MSSPVDPRFIPRWKFDPTAQQEQEQKGVPTQPSSSPSSISQQRQQGYNVRHQPPSTLTPQQQAQRQRVLMTQEGVPPKPKETPLTSGQKVSQQMGNVGREIWYGKQTGPEQIWQAPDVRYSYGPSTRQIMAETTANIGIGLTGGSVIRYAAPAAASSTGLLHRVYQASKIGLIGSSAVGTGAYGYQTYQQLKSGDTRSAAAGTLGFISGTAAFGVGAGAFEPRSSETIRLIKKASDINIRTGTPGSVTVGMRGVLQGSDVLNTQTTYMRNNLRIGERFTHIEDYIYKPSSRPELFLDTSITRPGGKVVSFGGAEVQSRVIPGVEKPMRMDILTGIEYKTVGKGSIRQTRAFIYNKYEPDFKPYVEQPRTRFSFEETTKPPSVPTKSFDIKPSGKVASSDRSFVQFEEPLTRYQESMGLTKMEQPLFRAYPPESKLNYPFTFPIQSKRGISSFDAERMISNMARSSSGRMQEHMRYSRGISDFLSYTERITIPSITPSFKIAPVQIPDVIPKREMAQASSTTSITDSILKTTYPSVRPFLIFPRKKLEGGGGEIADLQKFLSRYKFREFKIPELRL